MEELFGSMRGARPHAVYGPNHGIKQLPDGRDAVVVSQILGTARLIVGGRTASWYDDLWCYKSVDRAVSAMEAWDGTGEPEGWIRHLPSGRRRPDGDPGREYVRP